LLLKKGIGWRIGWRESASIYQGLIGSEEWAIELTELEMKDFCRLLLQIEENMQQMKQYLMAEEKMSCEVESSLVWLGAEGYPHNYSLRIIIYQDRGCEGNWSASAVPELIRGVKSLNFPE
jgi:hypothetical protein